jgi:hypothetical protein
MRGLTYTATSCEQPAELLEKNRAVAATRVKECSIGSEAFAFGSNCPG